jgi:hypothetical protein
MNDLKTERDELQKKLSWMNVQSDKRVMYDLRVREIDRILARPPDRVVEGFNRQNVR